MNIFCVLTSTYMSLRSLVDDNADAVVWMPLTKCDFDGRISVGEGRGGGCFRFIRRFKLVYAKTLWEIDVNENVLLFGMRVLAGVRQSRRRNVCLISDIELGVYVNK